MIVLIWGAVLLVSVYSFVFAVTIWKEKNKAGAIVVSLLSVAVMILPYFTYIK